MFLDETPPGLPRVTLPELWFLYRTNPAISFWDNAALENRMARFPFVVAFAFTRDETNHFADILLPDAGDLESLQLIRIGGSKHIEQFWDHEGFALRQPAIAPRGQARDFTDIATDLAARCGFSRATTPRSIGERWGLGSKTSALRLPEVTKGKKSGTRCARRQAAS